MSSVLFIFVVLIAYLMGSLCSAIIVSKAFSLPDPRLEGSKNPGATNVLRLAGRQYAIIVIIFDILKGVLPVLLAKALGAPPATVAFTCLAAVIGHMFPVFFQFKGGKGVATAIGALLAFQLILGVAVIATWLLVARFSRYSSLASIISMSLAPLYSMLLIGQLHTFPPLFFITIFILYKHRHNITRLMDGNEPKFTLKSNILKEIPDTEDVEIMQLEAERRSKKSTKLKTEKTRKSASKSKTIKPAKKTTQTQRKTKKTTDE